MNPQATVRITRIHKDAEIPKYATEGACAFDLKAIEAVQIAPGGTSLIPTGLVVQTPPGLALLLLSRSSTPKRHGLTMPHGLGLIDQDYAGPEDEILIQMRNFRGSPVTVPQGTAIAQGMFVPVVNAKWLEAEPADLSRGGFGSTDEDDAFAELERRLAHPAK